MLSATRGFGRLFTYFGSFKVGVWEDQTKTAIVPLCSVGSGLTLQQRNNLTKSILNNMNTMQLVDHLAYNYNDHPIILELRYQQITPDGLNIRFPTIYRVREDKPISDIGCLTDLKA